MAAPSLPHTEIVAENATPWGSGLQPAGCRICRQVFLVEENRTGRICPNCAQAALEPQPAKVRREPPELVAPFEKGRAEVSTILANFVKGVWLRPDDFNSESLLSRITPLYWPMWLVDADLVGDWQAEIGYDYQVKSSRDSYSGSSWVTNEVVEGRIRWEPRLGLLQRRYENIAAPALEDHTALMIQTGKYNLDKAEPFSTQALRASQVRLPDLAPEAAWPAAKTRINEAAAAECQQAAGGQHVRNFSIHPSYDRLNWTMLLLPLYATYYTAEDGRRFPVFINGQTGVISGVRMASQKKGWLWSGVLAGIAVLLFLLAVLLGIISPAFPPAAVIGGILGLLALVAGVLSLGPVLWAWNWNRGAGGGR